MDAQEFFPARWRAPGREQTIPTHPLLWKILGVEVAPDDGRVGALRRAMLEGDSAADALVVWMHDNAAARAMFETALERGIDRATDAPSVLREFFAEIERVP